MSNLPTRAPSDGASLTTATYRELIAALHGRMLTSRQAAALREIVLHFFVAARLLDEADAPDAPSFMRQATYRAGVAMTAIDVFRCQLAALAAEDGPPDGPFTEQLLAEIHSHHGGQS